MGSVQPIIAVIYDARYADARAFAAALQPRGATLVSTRGDSAGIWYGDFGRHIRHSRGLVAGLTTYADLVIAQGCCREFGLRLVYEGAHDARGSDRVAHRYRQAGAKSGTAGDAIGPRSPDHPGYLVSWLLAPTAV